MKKIGIVIIAILVTATSAFAVPAIQLFISGATYDWSEQSWIVTGNSFDLYVVSANNIKQDVMVSMALAPTDQPGNADINFAGDEVGLSDWRYGYAPIDNAWWRWNGGEDLPRHGIYPTWFTEINTGDYGLSSNVGDVQPDSFGNYWNPATGSGGAPAGGEVKMFHVETNGIYSFLHFDAYTLNADGSINQFAPFSHDAESIPSSVPEPGTIALMGTGLFGMAVAGLRRRKD
ncbi:MAG: hypothetical protein A2W25_13170 [candidate division Zixibacteria bacterium RBG_16_53_22]|nr:MAG: hypothetical protein A2W25_13170 [candidate division Zixibacteria bacterium RBG_16_53_22]